MQEINGQDCNNDNTPPVITVTTSPKDYNLDKNKQVYVSPADFITSITDNCDTDIDRNAARFVVDGKLETSLTYRTGCGFLGSNTETIVAVDKQGNISEKHNVRIIIRDVPIIEVENNKEFTLNGDKVEVKPSDFVKSVSTCSSSIGLIFSDGSSIKTYYCTDIDQDMTVRIIAYNDTENSSPKEVTFRIVDRTPPSFSVVSGTQDVDLDETGNITITANNFITNPSDNCGSDNISFYFFDNGDKESLSFFCADIGIINLQIVAVDASGNRSEKQPVTIKIRDTPPDFNVVTEVQTVPLDNEGKATIFPDDYVLPGSSGNCSGNDITYWFVVEGVVHEDYTFNCNDAGSKIMSIAAIDQTGNRSAPKDISLTVIDNTAPSFEVYPGEQKVYLDNTGNVTILPKDFIFIFSDNCTDKDDIKFIFLDDGADKTNLKYDCTDTVGTKTVHIVAIDNSNNRSASHPVTIKILDKIPPVITECTTINFPEGKNYFSTNSNTNCTYTGSFDAPTATDNCTAVDQLKISYEI